MAIDPEQISLIDILPEWAEAWAGMPAYQHSNLQSWRSIKVHFRNFEDWNAFRKLVGQNLGPRQLSMWYPQMEITRHADKNHIAANPQQPKYPVYIISKGRWESRYTARALDRIGVPYHIVVEPQEYENYAAVIAPEKILQLPFSNLGQGSIPARNWVWEHSVEVGAERHWILDDNIRGFHRFNENLKAPVADGTIFRAAEEFTDRYENIALSGFQYWMFVPRKSGRIPPLTLNTRIYSCILIRNDLPYRWRGRYNEDTDLSIRALKDGWCTALFNAFIADKITTMQMKGGNTDELYRGDGRLRMAQSLQEQHPDITTIVEKWGRWQHQVDYRGFRKNKLRMREELRDEFGKMDFDIQLTSRYPKTDAWAAPAEEVEVRLEADENFDPVLMEAFVEWYCPPGGVVFDERECEVGEFVARQLGRDYRTEECEADLVIAGDATRANLVRPGGYLVVRGKMDGEVSDLTLCRRHAYTDENGATSEFSVFRKEST
jgi:hypothetical protein